MNTNGPVSPRQLAAGVALVLLVTLGCQKRTGAPPADAVRVWVPLSATPLRGPANALVTMVLFCDFQSPFCARAADQVRELRKEFSDALRVQYRHNPLPIYPDSMAAAEASAAAAEQGQFWRYHDLLFERRDALDPASLERLARELGLDLDRFREAIGSERARLEVGQDAVLAAHVGARGAPAFFLNGRPLLGPVDSAVLRAVVREEIQAAEALASQGVAQGALYRRIAGGAALPAADDAAPPAALPEMATIDPDALYRVELGDSPSRGPGDALVTVVLWSDYECRRCAELEPQLWAIVAKHPSDIRVVWKHRPAFERATPRIAAEAGLAAAEQGKFWEMHDKLLSGEGLAREKLDQYAAELMLDLGRFALALDERLFASRIDADLDLAERLQLDNLPAYFVNGRYVGPAEPMEVLEARIEQALEEARKRVGAGVPASRLYETLMADAREEVPPAPAAVARPPKTRYQLDLAGAPSWGPVDAKVTIVTFCDFACPYCARLERTYAQLRARNPGKLRFVWRDALDVEVHADALLAHEAARAAGDQGKFWEMHDKIFARPHVLRRDALERHAKELGLDLARFSKALDTLPHRKAILGDGEYMVSVAGPSGTPTVFVNQRLMSGALLAETFQQVIDEELGRPSQNAAPGKAR